VAGSVHRSKREEATALNNLADFIREEWNSARRRTIQVQWKEEVSDNGKR